MVRSQLIIAPCCDCPLGGPSHLEALGTLHARADSLQVVEGDIACHFWCRPSVIAVGCTCIHRGWCSSGVQSSYSIHGSQRREVGGRNTPAGACLQTHEDALMLTLAPVLLAGVAARQLTLSTDASQM